MKTFENLPLLHQWYNFNHIWNTSMRMNFIHSGELKKNKEN